MIRSTRLSVRSKLRRDPNCPMCGSHPTIKEYIDDEGFCGLPDGAEAH
jgi:adenylyltransferase/sulfurtransferase